MKHFNRKTLCSTALSRKVCVAVRGQRKKQEKKKKSYQRVLSKYKQHMSKKNLLTKNYRSQSARKLRVMASRTVLVTRGGEHTACSETLKGIYCWGSEEGAAPQQAANSSNAGSQVWRAQRAAERVLPINKGGRGHGPWRWGKALRSSAGHCAPHRWRLPPRRPS